jgi:uncharacterized protein (DUF2164 family)
MKSLDGGAGIVFDKFTHRKVGIFCWNGYVTQKYDIRVGSCQAEIFVQLFLFGRRKCIAYS